MSTYYYIFMRIFGAYCIYKYLDVLCAGISAEEFAALESNYSSKWMCYDCRIIPLLDVVWGTLTTGDEIKLKATSMYHEIVTWKKNIFMLPRGKVGKSFILELTRIINLYVYDTRWKGLALLLVHIMLPLLLQKPSEKSKAKENAKYLDKRPTLWKEGDLDSIMSECRIN